ncbi:MAG: DEAD/DEAH box helicase family protein [Rhodobacteraceae bacterium]|nr:DEAD/DEAH box helicase family protein [Paracoccaceae bacterium]
MDFSILDSPVHKELPIHPIKVFESLPSLKTTPNDLWRGQAEALENWHKHRQKNDVLVSLNTGAGKTIVGLLIAQSLVNERYENVLYICSTIDLVKQTSEEASSIGLVAHTKRVKNEFDNDLFEKGKGFCITTYHALFNGFSRLRRSHFPKAIIFDDAHVAESILRENFTLQIVRAEKPELFNQIAQLFAPHFNDLGIPAQFEDSLTKANPHKTAFVAPRGLQRNKNQLLQIFKKNQISEDINLKYPFEHLKDHIEACAGVFTNGVFELTPPFLPSLAIDVFEQPIKRIYLSATLQSQTEFIRAFGRKPQEVIIPSNDAGNGERLIIGGQAIKEGFSIDFIKKLSSKNKVIIAVPNYFEAEKWSDLAVPSERDSFSEDLDEFRNSQNGVFILVSRVDGIDLPHETCRLMIMQGLPGGSSLLERYQRDSLRMGNILASKIANRIAQLFGRINRGRNDYGVFLLEGHELNVWLGTDRYVSLLPRLLQKQILLGRNVQEGLGILTHEGVEKTINSVLSREQTWLDYYEREIRAGELNQKQVNKAKVAEQKIEDATISEAKYAAYLWNKDYKEARIEIEKSINKIAAIDAPLSGWHSVWLGAVYDLEHDIESADSAYVIARKRIGTGITLPRKSSRNTTLEITDPKNNLCLSLENYLGFAKGNNFPRGLEQVKTSFAAIKSTSNNAEESVRFLGEILGFETSRPDNDSRKGPDVLWVDDETNEVLAFELKTDKNIPTKYRKKDIGQGHNHIAWVNENFQNYNFRGLVFIGPEKGIVEESASLSDNIFFTNVIKTFSLMEEFTALLTDLVYATPLERSAEIRLKSQDDKWKIPSILDRLTSEP